jgi:hypothetical protein
MLYEVMKTAAVESEKSSAAATEEAQNKLRALEERKAAFWAISKLLV